MQALALYQKQGRTRAGPGTDSPETGLFPGDERVAHCVHVDAHEGPLMTIAKRLVLLLAVPLLALVGLGVFTRCS